MNKKNNTSTGNEGKDNNKIQQDKKNNTSTGNEGSEENKKDKSSTGNEGNKEKINIKENKGNMTSTGNEGSENITQKGIPILPVTNVTDVIDVTNVTNVTYPFVTRVTRNSDFLSYVFGDSTFDKITKILAIENRAFTYDELAEKLGKSVDAIKMTITRKKEYFGQKRPNGKICYAYLLRMAVDEINQKIRKYQAKIQESEMLVLQEIEVHNNEQELVNQFKTFLDFKYKTDDQESLKIKRIKNTFYIDFLELTEFNLFLSEELEKEPSKVLKLFELAIKEFFSSTKDMRVRIYNLPKDKKISIEQLRANFVNSLISISGRVVTLSDVRPQVVNAKFECPSCGNIISVIQKEKKFREPQRCSCGRRGGFTLLEKEMVDTARLILEDLQEKTDNPHAKRLNCYLKEDLLNHENNKLYEPGNEVELVGILNEIPIPLNTGGISTRFELALDVNSVYQTEEEITSENLSEEEVKDIVNLSSKINDYGLKILTDSFAPEIYGHDYIKQAICLQLASKPNEVGKVEKKNKPNVLLIGDPGTSKSKIGEFAVSITPGARRSVGGSASAVGLTGAVVRDDYTGGWRLEPGAAVLAKDFYMIDELNNVRDEDKPRLQELLSEHTITFDKATIHAKLKAISGVLATANPVHGLFKNNEDLVKQFNLSPPIINRFDLIFVIRDNVSEAEDELIAMRMNEREMNNLKAEYDAEFLKKFFIYIKEQKNPIITDKISTNVSKLYAKLRKYKTAELNINPRVHVALLQLCKASAKIRLSEEVEEKDIEIALKILSKSYFKVPDYDFLKKDVFK